MRQMQRQCLPWEHHLQSFSTSLGFPQSFLRGWLLAAIQILRGKTGFPHAFGLITHLTMTLFFTVAIPLLPNTLSEFSLEPTSIFQRLFSTP
jgi:uncharacterized membrane protein YhdT